MRFLWTGCGEIGLGGGGIVLGNSGKGCKGLEFGLEFAGELFRTRLRQGTLLARAQPFTKP